MAGGKKKPRSGMNTGLSFSKNRSEFRKSYERSGIKSTPHQQTEAETPFSPKRALGGLSGGKVSFDDMPRPSQPCQRFRGVSVSVEFLNTKYYTNPQQADRCGDIVNIVS